MSVSIQLCQLCFCQILFELVYSWESYRKKIKSELFIETQCTVHWINSVARCTLLSNCVVVLQI